MFDNVYIYLCFDSFGLKLYVLKGYFSSGNITKFDINM